MLWARACGWPLWAGLSYQLSEWASGQVTCDVCLCCCDLYNLYKLLPYLQSCSVFHSLDVGLLSASRPHGVGSYFCLQCHPCGCSIVSICLWPSQAHPWVLLSLVCVLSALLFDLHHDPSESQLRGPVASGISVCHWVSQAHHLGSVSACVLQRAHSLGIFSCGWVCVSFPQSPILAGHVKILLLYPIMCEQTQAWVMGCESIFVLIPLFLGLVNGENNSAFFSGLLSPSCHCNHVVLIVQACGRCAEWSLSWPTVCYITVLPMSSQWDGWTPSIVIPSISQMAWRLLQALSTSPMLPARQWCVAVPMFYLWRPNKPWIADGATICDPQWTWQPILILGHHLCSTRVDALMPSEKDRQRCQFKSYEM